MSTLIWLDLIPVTPQWKHMAFRSALHFFSPCGQVPQLSPSPPNFCCLFFKGSSLSARGFTFFVTLLDPSFVKLKSLLLTGSFRLTTWLFHSSPLPVSDLQVNSQLSGFFSQPLIWYRVRPEQSYDASQTLIQEHLELWCTSTVHHTKSSQSLRGILKNRFKSLIEYPDLSLFLDTPIFHAG